MIFTLLMMLQRKKIFTLGYKPNPPFRKKKFRKLTKIFCKNRSAFRRINTVYLVYKQFLVSLCEILEFDDRWSDFFSMIWSVCQPCKRYCVFITGHRQQFLVQIYFPIYYYRNKRKLFADMFEKFDSCVYRVFHLNSLSMVKFKYLRHDFFAG